MCLSQSHLFEFDFNPDTTWKVYPNIIDLKSKIFGLGVRLKQGPDIGAKLHS